MTDSHQKAVVIIPFYKKELSHYDSISLQQCFKVLSNYTIIAIKPHSLQLPEAATKYKFSEVVSFDNEYFKSIKGYNQLMLSAEFYGRFLAWEYLLIHQLDAFVFKDELETWCKKEIDYVGAPWMRTKDYPNIIKATVSKSLQYFAKRYNIKKNGLPSKNQFDDNVGNGGFSLRRVKKFHDLCINYSELIKYYLAQNTHHYNEDVFWSIELNRKNEVLNIPGYKIALKFAFELTPERSYNINHHQLPFGCHAWDLHVDFWKPIFKELGYDI